MTLRGHRGPVYSVAYSPDGKLLASASADQTVKLWDPVRGACLATLTGHRSEVNSVAFSPDGEIIASAGDDGEVRLWSVAERSLRTVLKGHKDQVVGVRFAPNGGFLASADNSGVLILWDVKTSLAKARLTRHHGRIEDLDISPDSRLILTGGVEQPPEGAQVFSAARIWDVQLGRETWSETFRVPWAAHCVSFERQGGGFVAGDSHGNLCRWNRDGQQSDLVDYSSEQLKSIALSPDGSAIVVAGETRQIIVDRGGPGARRTTILHGHRGTVWGLSISPDSKHLASASHDGTIKIWDLGADCRYRAVDWGPAADLGTRDRSAQRFVTIERATGKYLVRTLDGQQLADVTAEWNSPTPLTAAALATDDPLLALGASDGSLRLYDYQQHRLLATLALPGGSPVKISFAAADHLLLAVAGGKLRVWDVSDRTHPALGAEWASTIDVAVSDNGESIAMTPPGGSRSTEFWRRSAAGWRKLWDCPSPAPGSSPPAFTADGRLVAVGDGENTVRIRDITSGLDLNVLNVTSLRNARLALSPDGRTLAIQALDRLTIRSLPAAMAVVDLDLRLKPDQMGFLPAGSALVVSGYSHSPPQPEVGESPDRYQVVNLTASRLGNSRSAASGESAQSR